MTLCLLSQVGCSKSDPVVCRKCDARVIVEDCGARCILSASFLDSFGYPPLTACPLDFAERIFAASQKLEKLLPPFAP